MPRAIDDYVSCLRTVRQVADYIVVNVSSPNTAGLRDLLEPLLSALLDERRRAPSERIRAVPLLLKISPDLSGAALQDIAALVKQLPLDGIIATNTTLSRHGLETASSIPAGGMSGRPLRPLALDTISRMRGYLGPAFPIIGVGGIDSTGSAVAMRAAGADLVQIYTGLIYRRPALVSHCVRALGSSAGTASTA